MFPTAMRGRSATALIGATAGLLMVAGCGATQNATVSRSAGSVEEPQSAQSSPVPASVLAPGKTLSEAKPITSPNGKYKLAKESREASNRSVIQYRLVFSGPAGKVWMSPWVKAIREFRAVRMTKSNLVIEDPSRDAEVKIKWSSNTADLVTRASGTLQTAVTDDGKLQIRGTKDQNVVVWENGVLTKPKGTTLDHGESLTKGQSIASPNGAYRLTFSSAGELVYSGGKAGWSSPKVPGAPKAEMRDDNNLIIRDEDSGDEWSSNTKDLATAATGPFQLAVTDKGDVQIRGTLGAKKVVWENGQRVAPTGSTLN